MNGFGNLCTGQIQIVGGMNSLYNDDGGDGMKIQRVWAVYYSATGHTAQAVETLAKALADALRVPWQKDEFTTPDQRHTVRYFAP